ncbi:RluA family pseudouridine synthase, partial [bacterium]|nr:RluA family pseudouridine synthase [bacterium]
FLAGHIELSRSRIKGIIMDGNVLVNGSAVSKPSWPVAVGDHIELTVPPVEEPDFLPEQIPLDIVYEDEHIIVINKPPGMVVHPARGNVTGTLAAGLLFRCRSLTGVGDPLKPGIVHRLDKNTSGLLVAALTPEAHGILSGMVHDRTIQRIYTVFVWGHPEPASGTVDAPIGRHPGNRLLQAVVEDGRPSVTRYETVARYDFLTMLRVTLVTGRTHQIRVHMESIGHHVFGDPVYGGREKRLKGFDPEIREKARFLLKFIDRQALHAGRLAFNHPISGKMLAFEAPLPADMTALREKLEEWQPPYETE